MNAETKTCQSCKAQFTIEPEDFLFYEKMQVPSPTWCPNCRMRRRLGFWGYRVLYKGKCALTGENIITFYHPDEKRTIYKQDVWWSDKWDPKAYGKPYDFSRPFFEQFFDLLGRVPMPALYTEYATMENSEYCNAAAALKNCYLCFKSDFSENSAYTNTVSKIKDSMDVFGSFGAELCYEIINCVECMRVFWSQDCEKCFDVYFSRDLIGCSNCVGCANLRNKDYHIFNTPYSKEEYERLFKEYGFGSARSTAEFLEKARAFWKKQPHRAFHGRSNENVSGDYIYNSKNVHDSYMVQNSEDIRYTQLTKMGSTVSAYDYSGFGMNAELIYECTWVGLGVHNLKFCFWNYNAHDLEYSTGCHGSSDLFGCVGIRQGKFCILNKEYSEQEYKEIVPKIKEQMLKMPYKDKKGREYRYGDFWPTERCPWGYNETTAQEFLPLSREEALAQGFRWRDPDAREFGPATVDAPDHIKDVADDVIKGVLKCQECRMNYKLVKMELQFYRKLNIPIPQCCPLCRDRARISHLSPIRIFDRRCEKCKKDITSSYDPKGEELVYCEACYQAEVV